ncbi:MAG: chemotaxis-specific protein-glutamate methyltransferase CheB [Candidatus Binatia bacterium]
MRQIRVLIVDDSLVERTLLSSILNADPEIEVLDAVQSGSAALAFLEQHKPDVITMDITMPGLDGYETTRQIMETTPVPIILVSRGWNPETADASCRAMTAGSVAAMDKPPGIGCSGYEESVERFLQTVKAMAEVKVVKRWARHRRFLSRQEMEKPLTRSGDLAPAEVHLVAIGASTGGPAVLQTVLTNLRKDFATPVVIAQHIAPGFLDGLTRWLRQTTGQEVHIADQGEHLLPGHIYIAPDGFHMGVESSGVIFLSKDASEHGMRPAVSYLFRSVIQAFGRKAIGVLLTGMGRDGAEELKRMRDQGSLTFAQNEETSVVFGMPGEAVKLGGAVYVLPPEKIAAMLNELAGTQYGVASARK